MVGHVFFIFLVNKIAITYVKYQSFARLTCAQKVLRRQDYPLHQDG